jgi:hypothetical protein
MLQELVAAMLGCPGSCSLLDEVHLCLMRSLAAFESAKDRKRRHLPLELLDEVSWGWPHRRAVGRRL